MVMGEEGLLRELREAGLAAYHVSETTPAESTPTAGSGAPAPAAVVVGMDRSVSYATLATAQAAVMGGALFVATNRDPTFPTPNGLMPGAGAIVAALATAAGAEPVLMGKPGPVLAETLAAVTGVPPARTLLVGDRLSTDIAMGGSAGMLTALVLTGVTSQEDLELTRTRGDSALPDHVLADLRELPGLLDLLGA
jgi:4-nitrophenyl phosphatase